MGVFLLLLSIYMLTHGADLFISDGIVMYRTTEAMVDRHSLALEHDPLLPQIVPGRDGEYYSKYGIGQPLAATVPFVLAQQVMPIAFPYMYDKAFENYFVTMFSQFVTAITGAAMFLLAYRLGNGLRLSIILALIWGLCTMAWPYSKTFFSEPLFTGCLVVTALGLLGYHQASGRWRFGWLALAGFALGYAMLTRIGGAVLLPAILAYALWATASHPEGAPLRWIWQRVRGRQDGEEIWPSRWRSHAAGALLAFGLPLAICLAVLLWHNWARFGSPLNNGYTDESFSTPLLTGLAGLLLSPGKSIFLYVPITMLAVVAWPRFWREQRAAAMFYAALTIITLVQTALWWAWWGGWCWGPRLLTPALPLIVLGLGPLLRSSRAARIAAWPLALAGMAVALLGTLVNFNPYLADLLVRFPAGRPGTEEPDLYFRPELSPILAHLRFLLQGEHLSVVTFDLERLGFHHTAATLFPVLVGITFLAGAAFLVSAMLLDRSAAQREPWYVSAPTPRPSPNSGGGE